MSRHWRGFHQPRPATLGLHSLPCQRLAVRQLLPATLYPPASLPPSRSYFGYDVSFIWWCQLIIFTFALFFRAGIATLLRYVSFQRR